MSQRGKNLKKTGAAILTTIVLLIVAAQPTYAAENFFQKFTTSIGNRFQRLYLQFMPGDKPGQVIFQQVTAQLPSLKTATMNTVITADLWQDEKNLANAKLTLAGPVEMSLGASPNLQQSLNVGGEVTVQGTTMRADMDVRTTDKTLYFKLNQIPALPFIDASSLQGKWLKTSLERTESSEKTELTSEQLEQLQQAYLKLMQSATYDAATKETKNGKAVYVVGVHLSKDALKEYVKTVMKITKSTTATASIDSGEEERVLGSLDKTLNNVGDVTAKLWVDRGNFYVRHLEVPLTIAVSKSEIGAQTGKTPLASLENVNKVTLVITTDLDRFNEPVTFDEPSDAQDAQQAFQELLSSGIGAGLGAPANLSEFGEGTAELPTLTAKQKAQLKNLDAQKMKALEDQMKKLKVPGGDISADPNLDFDGGEL